MKVVSMTPRVQMREGGNRTLKTWGRGPLCTAQQNSSGGGPLCTAQQSSSGGGLTLVYFMTKSQFVRGGGRKLGKALPTLEQGIQSSLFTRMAYERVCNLRLWYQCTVCGLCACSKTKQKAVGSLHRIPTHNNSWPEVYPLVGHLYRSSAFSVV